MAEKKANKKSAKIDDKKAKEAAKATPQALTKTDSQKAPAVKAASAMQTTPKAEAVKVEPAKLTETPKAEAKAPAVIEPSAIQAVPKAEKEAIKPKAEAVKVEPVKTADVPKAEAVAVKASPAIQTTPKAEEKSVKAEDVKAEPVKEAPKSEAKAESKKEADPSKEFVDGIMTEMALKGASKKRLIKKLAEQLNFDKQKVMFRLKRALITERYAAAHAEAGH